MSESVQIQPIRDIFAAARAERRPVISFEFFPPKDQNGERVLLEDTVPACSGFDYSGDLVQFIRGAGAFSVGVAGFPEGHVACTEGREADWDRLRRKIDSGADFVITQLFFRNRDYFELRDYLAARGVTTPIVPGILPILSYRQINGFVRKCGATLPAELVSALEAHGDDDDAVTELGIEYATRQSEELLREGAPGIHFYTLNRARSTMAIVGHLTSKPAFL